MPRVSSIIILLIFVLAGCDGSEAQLQTELEQQQSVIAALQQELADKQRALEDMHKENVELRQIIEEQDRASKTMASDKPENMDLDLVLNQYPWMKKFMESTKWDKIVLSHYEGHPDPVVIEDPLFIESIANEVCIHTMANGSYASGYPMHVRFEFYEGDENYTFELIDQYAIQIDWHQLFLWPDCNLYRVVEAYLPADPFVKHDGLVAKMAASGAIKRGDMYVALAKNRVLLRVWSLMSEEAKLLEGKPLQPGDRVERYTFYYHGDELYMDVYPEHVHLHGQGEELWYYYEGADVEFLVEPA